MKVTLLPPHDTLPWGEFLAREIEKRAGEVDSVTIDKITTDTLRHKQLERTSTVVTAYFFFKNENGTKCESCVDITWENGRCYCGAAPDEWRRE